MSFLVHGGRVLAKMVRLERVRRREYGPAVVGGIAHRLTKTDRGPNMFGLVGSVLERFDGLSIKIRNQPVQFSPISLVSRTIETNTCN